jgi:hypothetical protein
MPYFRCSDCDSLFHEEEAGCYVWCTSCGQPLHTAHQVPEIPEPELPELPGADPEELPDLFGERDATAPAAPTADVPVEVAPGRRFERPEPGDPA